MPLNVPSPNEISSKMAEPMPSPALPPIPAVGDVVQQGQEVAREVFGSAADVLKQVITSDQVSAEKVDRARDLILLLKQGTADILSDLLADMDQRASLLPKLSIEPDALLTALAQAMSSAADLVAGSRSTDLIVTEGKIFTEFYVKLPPPAPAGAFARIEINLKSKEYMRLSAGPQA